MTTTTTNTGQSIFRPLNSTRHGRTGSMKPSLRLTGRTLEAVGFEIGSKVKVTRDGNRLIIELA